jgi:hypothetical protein
MIQTRPSWHTAKLYNCIKANATLSCLLENGSNHSVLRLLLAALFPRAFIAQLVLCLVSIVHLALPRPLASRRHGEAQTILFADAQLTFSDYGSWYLRRCPNLCA